MIAGVAELAGCCDLESSAITPGTVRPIKLYPPFAAMALGGKTGVAFVDLATAPAPGTGLHCFGNRTMTAGAFMMGFENFSVLPLKLLATQV